jgi:hypothetical protein
MEESIAGFIQEGEWVAIVEYGERITTALNEIGVDGPAFSEWNEWRPKPQEDFSTDVIEKTAEQASTEEGEGERAGISPDEDLRTASEELTDATKDAAEGDFEETIDEGTDAVTSAARAVDSAGRKAIRTAEETVYKHVMTQVSPCYFDNELISANVSRPRAAERQYLFEVNINDDALKDQVSEQLTAYDEKSNHWRIQTEPDTETYEAAEGGTPSE